MADYPTEEDLKRIEAWDYNDFAGLLAFITPLFSQMGSIYKEGDVTYLATGGWSGNEDIIGAMERNMMLWSLYAESWYRGGLFGFTRSMDTQTVPEGTP